MNDDTSSGDPVPYPGPLPLVAATLSAQAAITAGAVLFAVIAPKLAADLGVNSLLIGYQVSLTYGTGMFSAALLSVLIPRLGACRTMQVSLTLGAIGLAATLFSTVTAIALGSVLLGLGMGVMTPASSHLLYRFTAPRRRNLVFSLKQTGVPVGGLLPALIAPPIALVAGWQWSVVLFLLWIVAMIVMLQRPRDRWDDDRNPRTRLTRGVFQGVATVWRDLPLRWLATGSFFFSFVQLSLTSFAVTMLVEESDYGLIAAGLIFSLIQVSGGAARVFWGWLADRSGRAVVMLIVISTVMIGSCIATATMTSDWPLGAVCATFAIFGASAVGWNGVFLAEFAKLSPRGAAGIATGGAMVWNFGGIMTGPAVFATAYRFIGSYHLTFWMLAAVAAAGLFCIVQARRLMGRPAAAH
jgi:MFS family permease